MWWKHKLLPAVIARQQQQRNLGMVVRRSLLHHHNHVVSSASSISSSSSLSLLSLGCYYRDRDRDRGGASTTTLSGSTTQCSKNYNAAKKEFFSTMTKQQLQTEEETSAVDDHHGTSTTTTTSTTTSSSRDDHQHDEVDMEEDIPRTSVLMELTDGVGVLHNVLRYFWKYNVNICRIESRPKYHNRSTTTAAGNNSIIGGEQQQQSSTSSSYHRPNKFDFFVDFEGSTNDANVRQLLADLRSLTDQLLLLDARVVHWFPRHISELDRIAHRTLDAGIDLQSDTNHPGFYDPIYRARRGQLAQLSMQHEWDQPIPTIEYTEQETMVWTTVWDQMEPLWKQYACLEYNTALSEMSAACGYDRTTIPQQQTISEYLQRKTQFRMRPVPGLLSSRDFLNGLAFRVFFSTQYIRHSSQPLYTPEPDLCHELLGHAPMLAIPDFADFSQEIGLASLGASDDDITKLAHCYWHSVEFGLCRENGTNKAYGAGLLSSFGELAYACGDGDDGEQQSRRPEIKPWDPDVAAKQAFPITTYQPVYFLADSLVDAKYKMRQYCENISRPFFAMYNPQTHTIYIDRPVQRSTKGMPSAPSASAAAPSPSAS